MKKKRHIHIFGKTTLFKKLLAFYLVIVMVSFYFMLAVGRTYIYRQVSGETADSLSAAAERLVHSGLIDENDTEGSLQSKRSLFDVAAKAEACQILLINDEGEIILVFI